MTGIKGAVPVPLICLDEDHEVELAWGGGNDPPLLLPHWRINSGRQDD